MEKELTYLERIEIAIAIKKQKEKKFQCSFLHCSKCFERKSKLEKHEKSKKAHISLIFKLIKKKLSEAKSEEELKIDEELFFLFRCSPDLFTKAEKNILKAKV